MIKIVLASNNKHKISEFESCFAQKGIPVKLIPISETGFLGDIPETGSCFAENAYIKAKALCDFTGLITIADDSGLCVDALDGAPGIYSARYAGDHGDDSANTQKLLSQLKEHPEKPRTASFVCAICAVRPDGESLCVEGKCHGEITKAPSGNKGFGYDPVFYCPEFGKTFAQLTDAEKNSVSHRGAAIEALAKEIQFFQK